MLDAILFTINKYTREVKNSIDCCRNNKQRIEAGNVFVDDAYKKIRILEYETHIKSLETILEEIDLIRGELENNPKLHMDSRQKSNLIRRILGIDQMSSKKIIKKKRGELDNIFGRYKKISNTIQQLNYELSEYERDKREDNVNTFQKAIKAYDNEIHHIETLQEKINKEVEARVEKIDKGGNMPPEKKKRLRENLGKTQSIKYSFANLISRKHLSQTIVSRGILVDLLTTMSENNYAVDRNSLSDSFAQKPNKKTGKKRGESAKGKERDFNKSKNKPNRLNKSVKTLNELKRSMKEPDILKDGFNKENKEYKRMDLTKKTKNIKEKVSSFLFIKNRSLNA